MKTLTKISALLVVIFAYHFLQAQQMVSEHWQDNQGSQAFFQKSVVRTDASGNTHIAGATLNQNGNYDLYLAKYNASGVLLWDVVYAGAGGWHDAATDLRVDASGNVYVTGSVFTSSNDSNDVVTLKYNASGVLQWDEIYNGSSSLNDGGTSLQLDASGNVYVSAFTQDANNGSDFLLLKYNNSGSLLLNQQFDLNNVHDVPVSLMVTSTRLAIAGATQVGVTDWDYLYVAYHPVNGSYISHSTSTGGTAGFDKVHDLQTDASGNFYLTGTVFNASTGYDILTVKLDDNLNVIWSANYNSTSTMNDVGNALAVDNAGNVIVTGFSETSTEGTNYVTIQYNSSSTQQWVKTFNGEGNAADTARAIAIDANDNVFITGSSFNGSTEDFYTAKYKSNGTELWGIAFNGIYNGSDRAFDIALDSLGGVLVSGQSQTQTGFEYATVRYEEYTNTYIPVLDSNDMPIYNDRELIVMFDSAVVNKAEVNRIHKRFGLLEEFVDTTTINLVNAKLGLDLSRAKTIKVFDWMTTADSLSITRLGDTIKIPPFWATFVVKLPTGLDVMETADSLNTLRPTVYLAEPNYIGFLTSLPNDPEFTGGNQASLHPTQQYSNAHINMDSAWDISTGNSYIKVGVFDTGINWAHDDFSTDGSNTWNGSKIKGGWDFYNNLPINNFMGNDHIGHGTKVAGVLGALRNNSKNVAGISGGNGGGSNDFGTELHNMRISENNSYNIYMNSAINAIVTGATNSNGYGLHIMNHSWSSTNSSGMLKFAVHFANLNHVSFVASSGNKKEYILHVQQLYPASYFDDWVMKVGASDTAGVKAGFSVYANSLDFIAPGVTEVVKTLAHNSLNGSVVFDGTSAAAPHVSGVASLMLSRHNTQQGYANNLAPEDVENILEKYAYDKYTPGYDAFSGWGRINAGKALHMINMPNYEVKHVASVQSISNPSLVQQACTVMVPNDYYMQGVPPGMYIADVYKVTVTVSHNIGNASIFNAWVRNSSSSLWANSIILNPWSDITLESYNNSSATLSAYIYFVWWDVLQQNFYLKWLPKTPGDAAKWAYSLHLSHVPQGEEDKESDNRISVFPNPANTVLNIQLNGTTSGSKQIELSSLEGKILLTAFTKENTSVLDIADLAKGLYVLKVKTEDDTFVRKIIKQ
ncbi:Thermophilic serine proteinase [Flavobacteriales bacterium]|nr:Thermophilic serine proteinase [Flavobacteriales bacterium]